MDVCRGFICTWSDSIRTVEGCPYLRRGAGHGIFISIYLNKGGGANDGA